MYLAQRADTTEGDFCQLVDADMRLIDLQLTDSQIESQSSFDLKKIVKVKARQAAFKYLIGIKESKTKMDNISYMNSFLPQSYLLTMTREQSSLMLALRTRTLRGIQTDFGNMFTDKQCPLQGCQELDSIAHLLSSPASCTCWANSSAVRRCVLSMPGDTEHSCAHVQSAGQDKRRTTGAERVNMYK